jgi:hypothetical protein
MRLVYENRRFGSEGKYDSELNPQNHQIEQEYRAALQFARKQGSPAPHCVRHSRGDGLAGRA